VIKRLKVGSFFPRVLNVVTSTPTSVISTKKFHPNIHSFFHQGSMTPRTSPQTSVSLAAGGDYRIRLSFHPLTPYFNLAFFVSMTTKRVPQINFQLIFPSEDSNLSL